MNDYIVYHNCCKVNSILGVFRRIVKQKLKQFQKAGILRESLKPVFFRKPLRMKT